MTYDRDLADDVRAALHDVDNVRETRMFGGLAFMISGNLALAASGQGGLLVRCDRAETDTHVATPGVTRVEMRGRDMDGWLQVTAEAIQDEASLERWVAIGSTYARSLPTK